VDGWLDGLRFRHVPASWKPRVLLILLSDFRTLPEQADTHTSEQSAFKGCHHAFDAHSRTSGKMILLSREFMHGGCEDIRQLVNEVI
jgi:hypothetical protein